MSPQVEYLEAIVTCKGNYYAPDFPLQLSNLYSKLEELVFQGEKKPFILKKVEPWNSIRVTLKMPADAARRLKQLYEQPDSILQTLGILAVHLEADNSIRNYNSDDNSFVNLQPFKTDVISNTKFMTHKNNLPNDFNSYGISNQISSDKNAKFHCKNFNSSICTSPDLIRSKDSMNLELVNKHSQNILSNKNFVSVNQNIASSSPLLVNLLKSPGTRNTQISISEGSSYSDMSNQISKKRKRNQPKNLKRFKQTIELDEIGLNRLMNQCKDVDNDNKNTTILMNNNLLINEKLLESEVIQNKLNLIGNGVSCTLNPTTNSNFTSSIKTSLTSQTLVENPMFDTMSLSNFSSHINANIQPKSADFDNTSNSINSNMIFNINNFLRLSLPGTQSETKIISSNSDELKTSGVNLSVDITQVKETKEDIFNLKAIKDLEASHRAKITDIFKPLLNGTSNLTSNSSIGTILEAVINKNFANILNGQSSSISHFSEIAQNSNFLQNLSSSIVEIQTDEKHPKNFHSKCMPSSNIINGCLPTIHQPICSTKQDETINKNLNILFSNMDDINEQQNHSTSYNLSNAMPVNFNGEIVSQSLQQVTTVLKNLQKLQKVQRPQQIEDPQRAKSNLTVAQLLEQVEIAKNNRSSPINHPNKNSKMTSNGIQSVPLSFSLPQMQYNNRFKNDKANKYNFLNDQSKLYSTKPQIFQSFSQRNNLDVFASVLNTSLTTQSSLRENFLTNSSSPLYPYNLTQSIQSVLKNTPLSISSNIQLGINNQFLHDKEQTLFKSSNHEFLQDMETQNLKLNNFNCTSSNSNFVSTSQVFLNPDEQISLKESICDEEGIQTMIASFYEAANVINNRKSTDAISTDFIGIELGADDEANINDIIQMNDYDEDIEKLVDSMSSSIGDEDLINESTDDLPNKIGEKYSQFSEFTNNNSSVDIMVRSSEINDQPSKMEKDTTLELIQNIKDHKILETSDNIHFDICSFKENIVADIQTNNQNIKNNFSSCESLITESLTKDAEDIIKQKNVYMCSLENDLSEKLDKELIYHTEVKQPTSDLNKKCSEIFVTGFRNNNNMESENMEVSFENHEMNDMVHHNKMSVDDCFEEKNDIYLNHNFLHDSNISKNHFINEWSDGKRLKKKKDPCLTDIGDNTPDTLTSKRMITRSSVKTKFLVVIDKTIEKNKLSDKNKISPRRSSRMCRHLNSEKQNLRSRSSILRPSKFLHRQDKLLEDVQLENGEIQPNTL